MGKTVLMQGNEACVEGALAAGMRLYAGYPITPSTEIAELIMDYVLEHGHIQVDTTKWLTVVH